MHDNKRGNALNLLIFVILMGPLIWLSQSLHMGETGTFVCVVIGLVGGWLLLHSGKSLSQRVGRTFNQSKKGAAADFLFSPSEPSHRQKELCQYRGLASSRVGTWNAPTLPMMPHPHKMPAYDGAKANRSRVTVTPIPNPAAPTELQVPPYSPDARMQQQATHRAKAGGPPLQLGPGAQMYLKTSLTGAIIVDAQLRRLAAPVFIEEWMRLGIGLLVVDVYGDYVNYLTPKLSEGFGFLAGSHDWQKNGLTAEQQRHYMPLDGTRDAIIAGQGIAGEGLQIVLNVPSYQNTTNAGTYLLALLGGIERKIREIPSKPCAIFITDARPLLPENDEDCLIADMGVAQSVFDLLMNLLEHAGLQALKNLAVFLAVPTLIGISDEAIAACRLWVVNSTDEEIINDVDHCLHLDALEKEQLQDGDVLLLDVPAGSASFARFRRTTLKTQNRLLLPAAERKTETLETEQEDESDPLGENLGLEEQQALKRMRLQPRHT